MDLSGFWQIIDTVNAQSEGDMDAKCEGLRAQLEALPAEEVLAFVGHFNDLVARAYAWDLWGAAYVMFGGCSDDAFMDFSNSLISMGSQVFETVLADPDSLVELDEGTLGNLRYEGFAYVAPEVYENKAGAMPEPTPDASADSSGEPSGEPWDEDETVLKARFPRLWAAYGESPVGLVIENSKSSKPWWKFW